VACKCVKCSACGGSGSVWFDVFGKCLGNRRCDDMDTVETCDQCYGTGLDVACDECIDEGDEDEAK
jgi:hypothetical protein